MGEPMHVYPDPNGGARSSSYVPSNTNLAGASIISGTVAAGAAGTALGPGFITNAFLFFQSATPDRVTTESFLGMHGLKPSYVAVIVFFASLSVVLQVINLARGIKMKKDLLELSQKVEEVCKGAPPPPPTVLGWWANK